jgi:hypothetical protein
VDVFIVNQNLQRELSGETKDLVDLDAQYFIDLSDDAVPTLVNTFQTPSTPDSVREKVGAALACIRQERELNESNDTSWQSFHFSHFNADNALASIKKELATYAVDVSEYPSKVVTPSGEEFPCSEYYYD